MPLEFPQFVSLPLALLLVAALAAPFVIIKSVNRLPEQWITSFVRTNRFTYLVTLLTLLLSLILLGSSSYLLTKERENTLQEAFEDLKSVREGVDQSLNAWIDDRKSYIESIARDRELTESIVRLTDSDGGTDTLLKSDELREIRAFFASRMEQFGDLGFFIISPQGLSLASMRDQNIGSPNLIKLHRPDLFEKALNGEAQFIPPIPSDVKLPSNKWAISHLKNLSMFFLAPVIDEQGDVIALISQRLDPTDRLSEILMLGRLGNSGESYLIDKSGAMLTKSRFDNTDFNRQVNDSGMFELRVPAANPGEVSPFTLMAQQTIKLADADRPDSGKIKFSIERAYPDYRGVPVIGVGAWIPTLQIGIASEIDEAEVLKQFNQNAVTFGISLLIALIVAITMTTLTIVFSSRASRILQRTATDLEDRVKDRTLRLANIIDNAADGIIVIDATGIVREFNPSAERVFGYSKAEMIGKNVNVLMPEPMRSEHDSHLESYAATGQKRMIGGARETLGRDKSGRVFEIDLAISESELDGEKVYTGLVRDISLRKQAERELVSAKLEAEQATQAKSEFLANMSHEIRTPMNAIIGMSELALQMELAPKQKRYIEKVNRGAESLLGIINDILDFSKIEAGKITLEQREFRLDDLLDEIADVIGMQAEEKGIELLFDIPATTETHFIGDALRLKQILLNLGSNAVKFTQRGEVVIKFSTRRVQGHKVELDIEVRDSGIGMSEEQANRLFQPFNQADNSITRKHGGTGLGLVICRSLVSLMDGQITLSSVVGQGTKVRARVVLGQGNSVEKRLTTPHFEGLHALVVDDNETSNRILSELLLRLGIESSTALSAEEALTYLNQSQDNGLLYDLLFVDWRMPEIDGLELIKRVEQVPSLRPTQTYILSAANPEDIWASAQGVNLNGVLQKPLNPSRLYDALASGFNPETSTHLPHGHDRHTEQLARAREKLAGAHLLVVEDNLINQEITVELLERVGVSARLANDGAEALKIIGTEHFDAVLMDVQMPVMDGYTATRRIRSQSEFETLPIIAMTANVMGSDIEQALAAGMNDHIGKPIDIRTMFATLIKWVKPNQPVQFKPKPESHSAEQLVHVDGIDLELAIERLGGDTQAYIHLQQRFVDAFADFETQLNDALERSEYELAVRLAHTLKGLSASIGATRLSEIAAELERQLSQGDLSAPTVTSVTRELNTTLQALQLNPPANDSANQVNASDVDLLALLNQLDELLGADDPEAIEITHQLSNNFYEHIDAGSLIAIGEKVEQYDFEAARQLLTSILTEHQTRDE